MPQKRSKKFMVLVAVFVLFAGVFLGGFLVLKSKSGSATISEQISYLLNNDNDLNDDNKDDADNDGLKDWEEKIYGSDLKKSDTDGDGYLDGEEVASGYDPIKKAPGDELAGKNPQNPRPLPKNLTKALGVKLSEAVATGKINALDQEGKPLNAQAIESDAGLSEVIQESTSQYLAEFNVAEISDNEINISQNSGPQAIKEYFALFGQSIGRISSRQKNEMQVFEQAMESGDFSELSEIQKIYNESFEKLKAVSAPKDLVAFHKGILGVIQATSNIYEAVKNISEDPLKTTVALMQYPEINRRLNEIIIELLKKMEENK